MSDIAQPGSVVVVQRRLQGGSQGGGRDPSAPPPKKVAATYQEIDRTKPVDDRITILGIPAEQITPATHAALASLVAEINFLRSMVQRHERAAGAAGKAPVAADGGLDVLAAAFAAPLPPDEVRVLVLGYLNTFEDVRRSSGLLAAKGLLNDVFARFSAVSVLLLPPARPGEGVSKHIAPEPLAMTAAALLGGAAMAGVFNVSAAAADDTVIAQQVRDVTLADGYVVSGIDMAVSLTVGAVVSNSGEGFLTALGRVDHLIRGVGG